MIRIVSLMILLCLAVTPVYAEKKIAGDFAVNLGVISWEQIQKGLQERPASHIEEYHYKMAKEMAKMHGGGGKGTYHILVVIDDKKTGRKISAADVEVTLIDWLRREKTIQLKPMSMDGSSGFGEFVRIGSGGTYVLRIRFRLSEKEAFHETEFVWEFPR